MDYYHYIPAGGKIPLLFCKENGSKMLVYFVKVMIFVLCIR